MRPAEDLKGRSQGFFFFGRERDGVASLSPIPFSFSCTLFDFRIRVSASAEGLMIFVWSSSHELLPAGHGCPMSRRFRISTAEATCNLQACWSDEEDRVGRDWKMAATRHSSSLLRSSTRGSSILPTVSTSLLLAVL